jgi:hypothetical protein
MKEWKTKFKVPIYDCIVRFVVTDDVRSSIKKLPPSLTETYDEEDDTCTGIYFSKWPDYAIVLRDDKRADGAVLDHEIGHVARKIMEDIGFKIEADNDEPLAYLEEFLTRMIHKRIKKL